jgi:hypothetical protein
VKEEYDNFLRDKTVALVGGNDEIDWVRVNQADYVVRVNDHFMRQGGRCDVIYTSCATDLDYRAFTHNLRLVPATVALSVTNCHELLGDAQPFESSSLHRTLKFVWANAMPLLFGAKEFATVGQYCIDHGIPLGRYYNATKPCYALIRELNPLPAEHQWLKNFVDKYSYPFNGIVALLHLSLTPLRSLYVDGYSFFTQDGITPKRAGCHHTMEQLRFCRELKERDNRISYSSRMHKIVFNTKYKGEIRQCLKHVQ